MDTFNKFLFYNLVKNTICWIQVKIVTDYERAVHSEITMASGFAGESHEGIVEALLDVRDSTFSKRNLHIDDPNEALSTWASTCPNNRCIFLTP